MNELTMPLYRKPVPPFFPTAFGTFASTTARPPLNELKLRLPSDALDSSDGLDPSRGLRRAAERAATVAPETPFPLLVFPCLFEEMSRELSA